ncbi:hypothetical protein M3P05_00855 [Sansalvadorimonas sp. 2012CJ34-2]|uniref:Uncharacterized protein n=1 Tax=Parendozoicomonas callyspongiae TaxID=2942213 RepID=A0ABT0PAU9_9GAMM|nr:hypothetical protein [Sansalvadorimonas sp. 2012CJ34-2]MCL6268500.1 hypothetical protein [Sansalvadorimonas sp. 2012CJ34-2]
MTMGVHCALFRNKWYLLNAFILAAFLSLLASLTHADGGDTLSGKSESGPAAKGKVRFLSDPKKLDKKPLLADEDDEEDFETTAAEEWGGSWIRVGSTTYGAECAGEVGVTAASETAENQFYEITYSVEELNRIHPGHFMKTLLNYKVYSLNGDARHIRAEFLLFPKGVDSKYYRNKVLGLLHKTVEIKTDLKGGETQTQHTLAVFTPDSENMECFSAVLTQVHKKAKKSISNGVIASYEAQKFLNFGDSSDMKNFAGDSNEITYKLAISPQKKVTRVNPKPEAASEGASILVEMSSSDFHLHRLEEDNCGRYPPVLPWFEVGDQIIRVEFLPLSKTVKTYIRVPEGSERIRGIAASYGMGQSWQSLQYSRTREEEIADEVLKGMKSSFYQFLKSNTVTISWEQENGEEDCIIGKFGGRSTLFYHPTQSTVWSITYDSKITYKEFFSVLGAKTARFRIDVEPTTGTRKKTDGDKASLIESVQDEPVMVDALKRLTLKPFFNTTKTKY